MTWLASDAAEKKNVIMLLGKYQVNYLVPLMKYSKALQKFTKSNVLSSGKQHCWEMCVHRTPESGLYRRQRGTTVPGETQDALASLTRRGSLLTSRVSAHVTAMTRSRPLWNGNGVTFSVRHKSVY